MTRNPYLIAEISCLHDGNLERAKHLAKLAKNYGADCLKAQKRNPIDSVPKEWHNREHPNPAFSRGKTYLEHRQNVELSIEEHSKLKTYCETINITYSTSVWDLKSAKEIIQLNPSFIKIPSAQNHNDELLNYLIKNYEGMIHISNGMTTKEERIKLHEKIKPYPHRIIPYLCTSRYPTPFNKICILEIKNLLKICPVVGISNHGYGVCIEIAAMALGATYFERHFTDDRCYPATDAAAAIEPHGLQILRRDLDNIWQCMQYKPDEIDKIELEQRQKLRGS